MKIKINEHGKPCALCSVPQARTLYHNKTKIQIVRFIFFNNVGDMILGRWLVLSVYIYICIRVFCRDRGMHGKLPKVDNFKFFLNLFKEEVVIQI